MAYHNDSTGNNYEEEYYDVVKEDITTTKYLIHSQINAKGFVEKPDVVGAIFGQTEGLLTDDLDLRELQKTGRIGRIKVDMNNKSGKTKGEVVIPSSLDRIETTILAASLETINRVGPCDAELHVTKIEDVRAVKRRKIVERAKELYKNMMEEFTPESSKMIEEVRESLRVPEIIEYGNDSLPAGPNTPSSDAILLVEGRSDVLNLLKYGIKNTIAVEGVNIPKTAVEITKDRTVTAFLDGDRGGDLILKELLQTCEIDYVTRAPRGLEVEYLNREQVLYALKNKTSVNKIVNHANYNHNQHKYYNQKQNPQYNNNNNTKNYKNKSSDNSEKDNRQNNNHNNIKNHKMNNNHLNNNYNNRFHNNRTNRFNNQNNINKPYKQTNIQNRNNKITRINNDKKQPVVDKTTTINIKTPTIKVQKDKTENKYEQVLSSLSGTNTGKLLDNQFKVIKDVKVESLYDDIKNTDDEITSVIFDGVITQRLVDLSKEKNIENLVAVQMSDIVKKPETIKIITKKVEE